LLRKDERMSNQNVIRAWKEPDYRRELTEAQRAQLPAHPAGVIEFRIQRLEEAVGLLTRPISPCHRCGSGAP
jgi:mersacidin/lichenicidin family type 2 lantibiotic